ncbi:acetoacetate--CoA ligase [Patulibacter sp.]|uniref:acetoacetate--CoA ligase n=1 Tax=Patulibacter sp. TaxID=1912859 RepID=UPI002726EC09|nr:acetoacetate--CoA ligase [Patulibacter sp.]MDO9408015.1 acetoacetate--CoA ligase [Patulibacter sp.]
MSDLLWSPTAESIEASTVTAFARHVERTHGVELPDYDALWRWSTTELETFWATVWEWFDVRASAPYERVLGTRTLPDAVTTWFTGARLNYAEHALREGAGPGGPPGSAGPRAADDDDYPAILARSESRDGLVTWTRGQLRERVAELAAGLRALGVGEGDRVVAYMPNVPETTAAFLACASLGATWASCSPDFGPRTVIDRFAQIEPKVLLAVDGYRYGGKDHDRRAVVAQLQDALPTVSTTVVLPYLQDAPDLSDLRDVVLWDDALVRGEPLVFAQVPFDHPLWVLYSSGTTGLPKPIVHGHGGIVLEHLKALGLQMDAGPGDRLFWFTTTGWMMWNLLLGGLLVGATVVLFDGDPGTPDLGRLWDLAEETGITTFGTSASFIAGSMKAGVVPREGRDLSALRAVGSTGSPLSTDGFDWVYAHLGPDLWLFSTSGGSDLCTAFVGGVPTLPVHRGELQARALGAALAAFDPEGHPLIGEVGELVVTEPMPSMPVFFWGDEDGSRYRGSYFEDYPGAWRHGDWITVTERGTAVISGRSDATINRGGIRMGTAEIYRAVLELDELLDAVVVDVPHPTDASANGRILLFVVLRDGVTLDDDLTRRIARRVREDCSPRHVPDAVHAVAAVPRTLSGKALEVPLKRILMGEPAEKVVSRDSLGNPEALDALAALAGELAAAG